MDHVIEAKVGQIWREIDPRFERHVRIEAIDPRGNGWALIQTVIFDGTIWKQKRRTGQREVLLSRFNGKRGNYAFHMEAP